LKVTTESIAIATGELNISTTAYPSPQAHIAIAACTLRVKPWFSPSLEISGIKTMILKKLTTIEI
jgi:hypothetical protein